MWNSKEVRGERIANLTESLASVIVDCCQARFEIKGRERRVSQQAQAARK